MSKNQRFEKNMIKNGVNLKKKIWRKRGEKYGIKGKKMQKID